MLGKAISFLKQNPDILEKFLKGEVSLIGLSKNENKAVQHVFSGNGTAAAAQWYWA